MPATIAYTNGTRVIDRRHREWSRKHVLWDRLLDAYEGGDEYSSATYGNDTYGYPLRNLIRHKREYPVGRDQAGMYGILGPPQGTDTSQVAMTDDFEMRRARTPVPCFVKEVSDKHLAKIYGQEVKRELPTELEAWGQDVDGMGNDLNTWMRQYIAPLLATLGSLDVCMGHPAPPEGTTIRTRGDEIASGTDGVEARYLLPQQMVWWTLDEKRKYVECLIREQTDDGIDRFRHWTPTDWTLYDKDGGRIDGDTHPFGRPPIIRLFSKRSPRYNNVGIPFYQEVADNQRAYYNRDSELALSDSIQAHPLLQGPEDYASADGSIAIGPGVLLPKKKNSQGQHVTYEGFEVIQFPKEGAISIRQNKQDIRDEVDRVSGLTKPAGAAGRTGVVVAQSGISKRLDYSEGNDLLCKMADFLEESEEFLIELALLVVHDGDPPPKPADGTEPYEVCYPREFDLFGPDEFATLLVEMSMMTTAMGNMPTIEGDGLKTFVRMLLRGKDAATYDKYDAEIDDMLAKAAKAKAQQEEFQLAGQQAALDAAKNPPDQPPVPAPGHTAIPGGQGPLTQAGKPAPPPPKP